MMGRDVCVIKNLDREWFSIIRSCNELEGENARELLDELHGRISLLFGFPKKVLSRERGVFVVNPDWVRARKWVDYHAGWTYKRVGDDLVFVRHPVRELLDSFCLSNDLWGGR